MFVSVYACAFLIMLLNPSSSLPCPCRSHIHLSRHQAGLSLPQHGAHVVQVEEQRFGHVTTPYCVTGGVDEVPDPPAKKPGGPA